jgi:signal peptidase I
MKMFSALNRHQGLKDFLSIAVFVTAVIVGAWVINFLVFRSFNVSGPSMETTLYTGDRLIVNRLPVTWEHIQRHAYVPKRGEIIVFKNPIFQQTQADEFIVKRVIAFPGERVVVKDGRVTVYNSENPNGFDPDAVNPGPGSPTSGSVDRTVQDGELFVMGDHRVGEFSLDSRNGLGTIPYDDIIGPVAMRIYPFTKIKVFN